MSDPETQAPTAKSISCHGPELQVERVERMDHEVKAPSGENLHDAPSASTDRCHIEASSGPEKSHPFGVELEHKSLREEILTRIRLRQQMVGVTLTLSGAFLGFGLNRPAVALVYPPLALFLAFGWAQNDHRIRSAASYIRKELEEYFATPGWERTIKQKSTVKQNAPEMGLRDWRYVIISHGGIFLSTQLLAIGVGVSQWTGSPIEWILLVVDVFTSICVCLILRISLK